MTASRRGLVSLLLLSLVLRLGHCSSILWTPDGVQDYVSVPLDVELGDSLVFICLEGVFSNVWIMSNQTQYDACDCSADPAGVCSSVGECVGFVRSTDLQLQIRQNTNTPASAIRLEVGATYYFASFSEGREDDQFSDQRRGGECSSVGLMAQVRIVGAPTEPSPSSSPSSSPSTPTPSSPSDETSVEPGSGPIVDGPMDNTDAPSIPGGDEDDNLPTVNTGELSGSGAVDISEPSVNTEGISSARATACCQLLTCLSVVLCSVLGTLLRH